MRAASWSLAVVSLLSTGSAWAQDPGDRRFAQSYVKASISVEIKGILGSKGLPPVLHVREQPGVPVQVWSLDIGQDKRLTELLGRLDGKLVVVTGTCGLRTVGLASAVGEPLGPTQPREFQYKVVGTAIDFERKLAVTSVQEASR